MASKNKKIKEPGADRSIFNMVRDYCKAPWVSTNKELPTPNKFILLAYYAGEDLGYRMAMGWLYKQVIKEHKKKKDDDNYITFSSSYFAKTINVNDNSDNYHRRTRDVFHSNDYEKEENISTNYEVIEENGEKVALVWFVCVTGDSAGIFQNSKSADSTFFPDLNTLTCAVKEYSKPDFWMYVPDIK